VISRQAPSKVKTATLEAECLRLRLEGLTHREIAAQLGVAPATAYRRVHHGLEEINQQNAEEAGMLRDLEALRLDELQSAIWQQAIAGDGGAINRVLAIMTSQRTRCSDGALPASAPGPAHCGRDHDCRTRSLLAVATVAHDARPVIVNEIFLLGKITVKWHRINGWQT